jgi:hypothetical protein
MWTLLSDGNDIVDVSPEAAIVPVGGAASCKFEVETANKKFGYIQFIENKDALKYAGKTASLQFKAYTVTGKAIRHLRAAVLSWASTADTITSDVVDAWGAEGTNPTLVANWTAENVAADLTLVADVWTTFKIENISIDTASMANLAVFIWVDDADATVDDLVYISQVQLNQGAVCLPWMPISFADELCSCMRFWQKSYIYTIPVGTNTYMGLHYTYCPAITVSDGVNFRISHPVFSVTMTKTPTISLYANDGTVNQWMFGSALVVCASVDACERNFRVKNNSGESVTPTAGPAHGHWVASAVL